MTRSKTDWDIDDQNFWSNKLYIVCKILSKKTIHTFEIAKNVYQIEESHHVINGYNWTSATKGLGGRFASGGRFTSWGRVLGTCRENNILKGHFHPSSLPVPGGSSDVPPPQGRGVRRSRGWAARYITWVWGDHGWGWRGSSANSEGSFCCIKPWLPSVLLFVDYKPYCQ